jgi:hypothetical protein
LRAACHPLCWQSYQRYGRQTNDRRAKPPHLAGFSCCDATSRHDRDRPHAPVDQESGGTASASARPVLPLVPRRRIALPNPPLRARNRRAKPRDDPPDGATTSLRTARQLLPPDRATGSFRTARQRSGVWGPWADWDATPGAGRGMIVNDFDFRGILTANKLSEFRDHVRAAGTIRTEWAPPRQAGERGAPPRSILALSCEFTPKR